MRALLVLKQPPLPEGGPPERCHIGLLRGLEDHGIDVFALAADLLDYPFAGSPPPRLPIEVVRVRALREGPRPVVRRLTQPRPGVCRGEFPSRVRQAAQRADVVHLEESDTFRCGENVRKPCVLHVHYLALRDESVGFPWKRRFWELAEHAIAERTAARRHRYLLANSGRVADELRKMSPTAHIVVAPLCLDPAYYDPPAPLDGPPTVGIIGGAFWPPTMTATQRLVWSVWPLVVSQVPEARLLVAGRGMKSLLGPSLPPGVEVIDEVDSAARFLRALSLLLYPLERGSGMKVKVLESLALGLPVVTTTEGAEGVRRNDGVIVESSYQGLAAAAVAILRDQGERRERGAAALDAFNRWYSPYPATEPIVDLYARMLDAN